jgi:hypothetical protein
MSSDQQSPVESPLQDGVVAGRRRSPFVSFCWLVNVGLLVTLVVWIWNDRDFTDQKPRQRAYASTKTIGLAGQSPPQPQPHPGYFYPPKVLFRRVAMRVLASLAAVSFLVITFGLFLGGPHHRRLRSWFAVVTLAAAWLAVSTSYGEIMWASQVWTISGRVDDYESYAAPLRREWPSQDGAMPEFGAFSAYPIGKPTTLSLLTTPRRFRERSWGFNEVHRASDGALRFHLQGDINGWLEWHPEGSKPESFEDGLNVEHQLVRTKKLGGNWHFSTYGSGRLVTH